MEKELLSEIHKYDRQKYFKKYNIDLWSIVYLLQKWKFIKFNNSIFSIQELYNKKYYNKINEKRWDSDLNTKNAIENDLQNLWLINKIGNKSSLTPQWAETIKNLYIDVNWNCWQRFEKYIIQHPIITFIVALSTFLVTLATFVISLIWLIK